jgi:hypothetical protein
MDTLESCKAHAYDVLAQMEALQKELQATNLLIEKYTKEAEAPVEASEVNTDAVAEKSETEQA